MPGSHDSGHFPAFCLPDYLSLGRCVTSVVSDVRVPVIILMSLVCQLGGGMDLGRRGDRFADTHRHAACQCMQMDKNNSIDCSFVSDFSYITRLLGLQSLAPPTKKKLHFRGGSIACSLLLLMLLDDQLNISTEDDPRVPEQAG